MKPMPADDVAIADLLSHVPDATRPVGGVGRMLGTLGLPAAEIAGPAAAGVKSAPT